MKDVQQRSDCDDRSGDLLRLHLSDQHPLDGNTIDALTPRQRQIVALLRQGMCNKEIARALKITDGTVKQHLHAVFDRLGVTSRWKLMAKLEDRK